MSDYLPNPTDRNRYDNYKYDNYDFTPGSGRSAAFLLIGLLVALVLGFLFVGGSASNERGMARNPDQTMSAPTANAPTAPIAPQ